ncbi:MAG: hypothetical protein GXO87_04155 [Chlorobi bacterium]|nr:hypothetical protein [Chlorobiota bacterium]
MNFQKIKIFALIVAAILSLSFAVFAQTAAEKILVGIGEKTITVEEFINRAELTPRPSYAKGNSNAVKNIVLNSLIAEKLIALDKENNTELNNDRKYLNFIKGRKEQKMREILYRETAYDKASVDSSEVIKELEKNSVSYTIEYFTVPTEETAKEIKQKIGLRGASFEKIYYEYTGDKNIPEKEITRNNIGIDELEKILYGERKIRKYEILGPIKVNDRFLFVKIINWKKENTLSASEYARRFNKTSGDLRKAEADKIYAAFIKKTMKGKKIEFNDKIFFKLAEILAPFYVGGDKGGGWKNFSDEAETANPSGLPEPENIKGETFYTIDGEKITVEDFLNEIEKHPLVFRKSGFAEKEFPALFRLSVADMVRDKFLTDIAYERKLDQRSEVKRETEMWKDAVISLYESGKFSSGSNSSQISSALSAYIVELNKKYKNRIKPDYNEFEKIRLTDVDLFAVEKGAPFPAVVPPFPKLTKKQNIDDYKTK